MVKQLFHLSVHDDRSNDKGTMLQPVVDCHVELLVRARGHRRPARIHRLVVRGVLQRLTVAPSTVP
ncbi:hypothetical protein AMTR_s00012p00195670 [Amborella trichopoda]|uniref:Uncharacterized protein n=1 Tax=Amborella trichopoda TaxID=13333 RepID=W1PL30_AMBTC|nr:hypothetical protein AMTR_s00012p00195670 [Amborella trichopoda]